MEKTVVSDHPARDSIAQVSEPNQSAGFSFERSFSLNIAARRSWGALLILCTIVVAGCSALNPPDYKGLLLKADFEAYQEGTPVGLIGLSDGPQQGVEIPGLPAGDRIIPQGGVCNGSTYTVRSNDPLSGQKSLLLQHDRLPTCDESCSPIGCEDIAIIDFVPVAPDDSANAILLFLNGKLSNTMDDTVMEVSLHEKDEFFSTIRLQIHSDRMEVFNGSKLEKIVFNDFGTAHSIFVRLAPGSGTYGVQVAAPGLVTPPNNMDACAFPQVACGEFSADNFDPTAIILRMQFLGDPLSVGVVTPPVYRVDNVKILQE